jgi:N-carbamoyl-L-amino-acid hydrolase
MASGAAHDAMVFARAGVPSVMLFVPSRGGVSHSPDEFTAEAELATGHRAALELCSVLAARGAT